MKIYPIDYKVATKQPKHNSRFFCIICGTKSRLLVNDPNNLRENCVCTNCTSINRQRQIAYALIQSFKIPKALTYIDANIKLYNTESTGSLHNTLKKSIKNYYFSEYFGSEYTSGSMVNGIMHQDLMNLSFENDFFDVVLSSDVFEHIPEPYKAFAEVNRILKKGGRHIFTVPFYRTRFKDEIRAKVENNTIIYLKEAQFHGDPVRPEAGILVYSIFSIEMLSKLSDLGFYTNMYLLFEPEFGIYGDGAIVFESIKE